jgi:hypothetical protein
VNDASKWINTGKAARFDRYGRVLEFERFPDYPKMKTSTNTVYGHQGLFPVATIRNAGQREAGVLTGGYYDNVGGYLDQNNGWEIGGHSGSVQFSTTFPLFGSGNIKVINDFGPTRNTKVAPGKEYRLTAWVRVESGRVTIGGDFRRLKPAFDATESAIWPITMSHLEAPEANYPGYSKTIAAKSPPIWEKVQVRFRTDNLPTARWYSRHFIGTIGGGTAYIQDVRFLPSDALATSIHYTTPMMLPEVSLDENSNPGRKTKFDGFGRPVQTYKMEIEGSVYTKDILAESKEYLLLTP